LLAANGVPVRVAMDVLGHANITTTQNVYTHVFDNAKRQAAEVMERVFSGQQHEA
jgi:integrase